MQCYGYEALCRTLVVYVKEREPGLVFEIADAADAIDAHGIESVAQLRELESIAREIAPGARQAA